MASLRCADEEEEDRDGLLVARVRNHFTLIGHVRYPHASQ